MAVRQTCGFALGWIVLVVVAAPTYAVTWGDVNNDGSVNLADIPPFIDVLLNQNTDPIAICAADVNADGTTDAADIPDFVDTILLGASDLLISDNSAPCAGGPFRRIEDGDVLNVCGSFSGFTMFFLTVRMAGFPSGATVDIAYSLQYMNAQTGCPARPCPPNQICQDGLCHIGVGAYFAMPTTDIGCRINEFTRGEETPFDILFSAPAALDGQEAILSVTVTDSNNPAITASKTIQVILDAHTFCFTPAQCPADHVCIDNYCVPN